MARPSGEELFSDVSGEHWWRAGKLRILRQLLSRTLPCSTPRHILEAGCGDGFNFSMLTEFGRVDGLETDESLQRLALANHPGARVYNIPIGAPLDEVYDAICIFDVLEHIPDQDMAVNWLHGHLKPGGRLFVTVPAYQFLWTSHDSKWGHVRRYTRASLIEALSARFTIDRTSYFNTHLFPAALLNVAVDRLLRRSAAGEARAGSATVNALLREVFAAEAFWLRFLDLPFGVSLYAEASRR